MKPKKGKQVPLEQALKMAEELNPDDLEVGAPMDFPSMIEQRDDYNPDDNLRPNPKVTNLGGEDNER